MTAEIWITSDRLRSIEKAPGNLTGHQRPIAFQEPDGLESGVLRHGLITIADRLIPVIFQVKAASHTTDD